MPRKPSPENTDWLDFLHWLAESHSASQIVNAVEKPWHWAYEYEDFLADTAELPRSMVNGRIIRTVEPGLSQVPLGPNRHSKHLP